VHARGEQSGLDSSMGLSFIDAVAPPENSDVQVTDSMLEEPAPQRKR
jgi:hypothetical protein